MVTAEFWEDFKWGHTHHTELLKSYRDEWVAITNKQVVSAGTNLAKVKQEAELKTRKKGIPTFFVESGQFPFQNT